MTYPVEFNSNPHNYERRIGGFRPESLVVLILSVLISTVFYEYFGIIGIVPFFLIILFGLVTVGNTTLFGYSLIRIAHGFSSGNGTLHNDFRVYTSNGTTFISDGVRTHLPLELGSRNLIGLSEKERLRIYDAIREALNSTECDLNILIAASENSETPDRAESESTGYKRLKSLSYENSCYHVPYLILSWKEGKDRGIAEQKLMTEFMKITGFLGSAGLVWNVPGKDSVQRLLSLRPGIDKKSEPGSYIYQKGRRFFFLNGSYHMAIRISDFRKGPLHFLSQGLDALDFPCFVQASASMYEATKAKKLLKYMITERSTDIKLQKSSSSASNNTAERQLRELSYFLKTIDNEGDRLVNSSYTLIFGSDDPTGLTRKYQRIVALLDFLGLEYSTVDYYTENKIRKLLPLSGGGLKYMTSTGNLSGILPLFLTPRNDNGLVIGLNSATEKPEVFTFFGKNSYNVMILGETGSGKSHFSKLLLGRGLSEAELDRILIIDPLEEYTPEMFNKSGRILNLSSGDYFELPEDDSFDALNYVMALVGRVIQFREADVPKFRSVVTASLKDRPGNIKSILMNLMEELQDYSDEIQYAISTHFRDSVDMNTPDSPVTIVRLSAKDQINREMQLLQMIASSYSWMSSDRERKAVVIDEAHILLGDESVTKIMDSLVRNSRHFNTAVINITQNFSDFERSEYSRNITNNTSEFFVFRSKTDGSEFKTLFRDAIPDSSFILNLRGGKNDRYSECVRVTDSRAYPIKIISTEEEMNLLSQ